MKPLPIHSCPFRPLLGKVGPKAAGLAANEVLLSSAMVMIAFGGKRVNGVEKEKRDLKLDFCEDWGEDTTFEGWATEVIARHRRKRQAAKKRTRMAILGGLMVAMVWECGHEINVSTKLVVQLADCVENHSKQ